MKMLLTPYELKQIQAIQTWLNHHENPFAQAWNSALHPLEASLVQSIPPELSQKLHQSCNQLTDNWLDDWHYLQTHLTSAKTWQELRHGPLETCDRLAQDVQNIAVGTAAVEAGLTSLAEGLGEIANVGLMILLSLTVVQRVGLAYGFPPNTPARKNYLWGILALTMASSPEERLGLLKRMAQAESDLYQAAVTEFLSESVEDVAEESTQALLERLLVIFTAELGGEVIPVIGTLWSITASEHLIQSLGTTAQYVWQLRWLLHRETQRVHSPPNLVP